MTPLRPLSLSFLAGGLVVGFVLGCFLWSFGEATYSRIGVVLWGLESTLVLGLLSGWLLETHVYVQYPKDWENFNFAQEGGGAFLGFLERLILFAGFWYAPVLGGAWLAFKLGAKWGVWHHVIKYPETTLDTMQDREQLGSRVLGRFLNGTCWNAVCGLIGAAVAMVLWSYLKLPSNLFERATTSYDYLRLIL